MPMPRDNHETLLNELMNPELNHTRRTEILQELRTDYGTVLSEHDEYTTKIDKLSKDNSDLVLSNSKLFRQIGLTDSEDNKENEKKEFSETITISDFEKE